MTSLYGWFQTWTPEIVLGAFLVRLIVFCITFFILSDKKIKSKLAEILPGVTTVSSYGPTTVSY